MSARKPSDDPDPSGAHKAQKGKGKQHERSPSITFTELSDSDLAACGISQLEAGSTGQRDSGCSSQQDQDSSSQRQSGSAPGRTLSTLPMWVPHSPRGQLHRRRASDHDRQREMSSQQLSPSPIPSPREHSRYMHTLSRGGYSPEDSDGIGPVWDPFLMRSSVAAAAASTSCDTDAASATIATKQCAADPLEGRLATELTVPFRQITLNPKAPGLLSIGLSTAESARQREAMMRNRVSAAEQPSPAGPSYRKMISPQPGPRENRFYRQELPGIDIEEREVSPSPKPRKGLRERLGIKTLRK